MVKELPVSKLLEKLNVTQAQSSIELRTTATCQTGTLAILEELKETRKAEVVLQEKILEEVKQSRLHFEGIARDSDDGERHQRSLLAHFGASSTFRASNVVE